MRFCGPRAELWCALTAQRATCRRHNRACCSDAFLKLRLVRLNLFRLGLFRELRHFLFQTFAHPGVVLCALLEGGHDLLVGWRQRWRRRRLSLHADAHRDDCRDCFYFHHSKQKQGKCRAFVLRRTPTSVEMLKRSDSLLSELDTSAPTPTWPTNPTAHHN